MKNSTYKKMWIKCFSPVLIDFKVKNDVIEYNHNSQKEILNTYNHLREVIKENMSENSSKIDRHKIISLIILSVLKVCPFKLKSTDFCLEKEKLINELFAFEVGTNILKFFIYTDKNILDLYTEKTIVKYIRNKKFVLPNCSKTEGDYLIEVLRLLNIVKKEQNFNLEQIVLLSHILFFIEHHTLEHIKYKT